MLTMADIILDMVDSEVDAATQEPPLYALSQVWLVVMDQGSATAICEEMCVMVIVVEAAASQHEAQATEHAVL